MSSCRTGTFSGTQECVRWCAAPWIIGGTVTESRWNWIILWCGGQQRGERQFFCYGHCSEGFSHLNGTSTISVSFWSTAIYVSRYAFETLNMYQSNQGKPRSSSLPTWSGGKVSPSGRASDSNPHPQQMGLPGWTIIGLPRPYSAFSSTSLVLKRKGTSLLSQVSLVKSHSFSKFVLLRSPFLMAFFGIFQVQAFFQVVAQWFTKSFSLQWLRARWVATAVAIALQYRHWLLGIWNHTKAGCVLGSGPPKHQNDDLSCLMNLYYVLLVEWGLYCGHTQCLYMWNLSDEMTHGIMAKPKGLALLNL